MASIQPRFPREFRQGTTVKWTLSVPDYLPANGWVLTYRFARSTATIQIVATDNGDGTFLITIPASGGTPPTTYDSSDFETGLWGYAATVAKAGEVFEVKRGSVNVLPSLTTAVDIRSEVKKALDAIVAVIEKKWAAGDALAYSIQGRSLSKYNPTELENIRREYEARYQAELDAENAANGLGTSRRINLRVQRV